MGRAITRAQNRGSFAAVKLGGQLKAWYYDPDTLLTQMTSKEIAKCDPPLELASEEDVHFVFAESARVKRTKRYVADGVCLINPRTGAVSRRIQSLVYVVANDDLLVYPRVLGKNTIAGLNVSTHHESGTISDDSGNI